MSSAYLWMYQSKTAIRKLVVLLVSCSMAGLTFANPEGGVVTAGDATITQSPGNTQIQQHSQQAIVEWRSFNIGASEKTQFVQPNASSIALNRISPNQGASQIYGQLTANGRIILVNQAGIYFGPTARVDVAGIIASTSDITNQNFLNGNYIFDQASSFGGSITNAGQIIAAEHGLVALVGNNVRNDGMIEAHSGNIVLASGNKFTLDFNGDELINFSVDEASEHANVTNKGTLNADGGRILITAKAAQGVIDNVINMEGVALARSVSEKNGEIILDGHEGTVNVAGTLNASGKKGGTVKILAKHVRVHAPTVIDASGEMGGGEILIGGNAHGAGPERNALDTIVDSGVVLNASAIKQGNGGKIIVWSDNNTQFHGDILSTGGMESGDGGFVETSGHYLNVAGAKINTSAPLGKTGTWLLDPTDVTISGSATSNETYSAATDPATYTPATNTSNILASELIANLATNNINVLTASGGAGNGDIAVNAALTWASNKTLTLTAARNIYLNADITATNGGLVLSAVNGTQSLTAGSIGSGTLGTTPTTVAANINVKNFTLAKGQWFQSAASAGALPTFTVSNDFQITSGTVYNNTFNGQFTRINTASGNGISDVYGLQGFATANPSGSYNLSNNIDARSTSTWRGGNGFVSIALGNAYTGTFDGNSHTIDSLYQVIPSGALIGAGLFSYLSTGGTIRNIGLTNINLTGNSTQANLAPLVQFMDGGTITNAYATGTIGGTVSIPGGSVLRVGGLIGIMLGGGSVSNSYSAVNSNVTISNNGAFDQGGFVARNQGGTISNSYALGNVAVTITSGASTVNMGGFVGSTLSGTTTTSYSTGTVTETGLGGVNNVGAFAGGAGGVISNSFWDVDTSGRGSDGSTSGSDGGTGKSTANMMTQTTFTGAGWTFDSSNWGIIGNKSYPYLRTIYTGTPRVISGATTGVSTNTTVTLTSNGTALSQGSAPVQNTARTGSNGFYYFLEGNGSVTDGNTVLVYLPASAGSAVTLAPSSGGSITGLNLASGKVSVGDSNTNTLSNTLLQTAAGSLGSSNTLYSVASAALTLNSGIHFLTTATTTYTIDGNMTASGNGSITFNGAATAGATATVGGAGSGAVTLNSTLNGANALTLAGAGGNILAGIVGGGTALTSLTLQGGGTDQINTTAITTTGSQTYYDTINLGASTTLTGTDLSILNGTVASGGNALTLDAGSSGVITLPAFSGGGNITITNSGGTTFGGAITAGAVTLTNTTGTIAFNGALTATALNTAAQAYALQINNGGTITNAVTFSNTGVLTLGDAAADNLAFTAGAIATAPSQINLAGTISAAGTGVLNFGAPVSVTDTATVGGTSTGQITLGAATIAAGKTLTVGTGTAAPISLSTLNGATAGTASVIVAGGGGALSLNGAIGNSARLAAFTASNTGAANDITIANNISTANNISITAGRNLVISSGTLNSTSGNVSLTGTSGTISETGAGLIGGALLTTNSAGGTTLNNANTVTSFNATNSSSGNIAFTNTGAVNITGSINSGGGLIINGGSNADIAINGALQATNAITITSAGTGSIQAAANVTTSDVLTLNGPLVIGTPVTFTASSFALNQGASGAALTLNGNGSGNNTFALSGPWSNTIILAGNSTGSNSLQIMGSGSQNWAMSGNQAGTVTSGSGTVNFGQIASLIGGSGTNTLTGSNAANTWSITGSNSGTVSGSSFSSMQNLAGGSTGDTFNFSGNASVSGTITGGNSSASTLNYTNYGTTTWLSAGIGESGTVKDSSGQTITSFNNIGNVFAKNGSTLQAPNKSGNNITITSYGAGILNDPITFSGFNNVFGQGSTQVTFGIGGVTLNRTTGIATFADGQTMYFTNISGYNNVGSVTVTPEQNASISSIISQTTSSTGSFPSIQDSSSDSTTTASTSGSLVEAILGGVTVNQNINTVIQNQDEQDIQQRDSQKFGACGL